MNKALGWIPVSCEQCKHRDPDSWGCAAFPEGIPFDVRGRADSHLLPLPNDRGIQFEPSNAFLQELEEEGIL
jgi:hypothetical protein